MLALADKILHTNLLEDGEDSPPSACCAGKKPKST